MPNVSTIKSGRQAASFEFDGETVEFVFNPREQTPALWDEYLAISEEGNEGKAHRFVVKMLAKTLVEWNVEDDGTPYPITVESLNNLPFEFLSRFTEEIGKHATVDEDTVKA